MRSAIPALPRWLLYSLQGDIILYNDRVVTPPSLRQKFLGSLQRMKEYQRRARAIVFWPGMTHHIHRARDACVYCSRNAPSQAAPPRMPSSPPTTPFEQIFADYFDYGERHFLIIGDRFFSWANVFAIFSGSSIVGAAALIDLLRTYFASFGVPDQISTDGAPRVHSHLHREFIEHMGSAPPYIVGLLSPVQRESRGGCENRQTIIGGKFYVRCYNYAALPTLTASSPP